MRIEQLFSKSSLKQLYRKLALALHPDREPDPAMQAEKTRIMGQLQSGLGKQRDVHPVTAGPRSPTRVR